MASSTALSNESRALRASYVVFKKGVDPDVVITALYSMFLLTQEEKEKATQRMLTPLQQLDEVFVYLERRVSVDPSVFHQLVQVLLKEPALEMVGRKMQAHYDEEQSQNSQHTFSPSRTSPPGPTPQGSQRPHGTITVLTKTESALDIVNKAVRALESGNASRGYELFGDVKGSGLSIINDTEYLLDRISAVEKYCREHENARTRQIFSKEEDRLLTDGEHYLKHISEEKRRVGAENSKDNTLQRVRIHIQRGEVQDSIKYLHGVLDFWKDFSQLTKHGMERATLLQKLSEILLRTETKHTSGLSRQLQSCASAWHNVKEKLERRSEHLFLIDFTCHFCHGAFCDLPHSSYGNFCCSGCYT